jgi:hypothetical protein
VFFKFLIFEKGKVNDLIMSEQKFGYYYRIVTLEQKDEDFYIGFARKCVCGNTPEPCVCNPNIAKNGIESGEIYFDRKSFINIDEESPLFCELTQRIGTISYPTPIIYGYEESDTGVHKNKKILHWKLPKIPIIAQRLPDITHNNKKFNGYLDKIEEYPALPNQIPQLAPLESSENKLGACWMNIGKTRLRKNKILANSSIPEFRPKKKHSNTHHHKCISLVKQEHPFNNAQRAKRAQQEYEKNHRKVFSEISGVMVEGMWKSDISWKKIREKSRTQWWTQNDDIDISAPIVGKELASGSGCGQETWNLHHQQGLWIGRGCLTGLMF